MKRLFSGTREDTLKEKLEETEKVKNLILRVLEMNLKPNLKRDREKDLEKVNEEIDKINKDLEELRVSEAHSYVHMPKDCFLNDKNEYTLIGIGSDGRKYWKDTKGFYYNWDSQEKEVEYYDNRKRHLGSLQVENRNSPRKKAVKGRRAHI